MAPDEDTGKSEGEWIQMGAAPPQSAQDRYWDHVERTLTDVFEVDPHEAERKVRDMRDRIKKEAEREARVKRERTKEEPMPGIETIFYHATPLDVAADLAGHPRDYIVQPEERRRYVHILTQDRDDRPEPADVAKVHPED
jgi:hypothetical protein